MKRMITALCAMMLVPTLAAAKNEGISVTELREQIETLGRWTASYTDVKGRTVEVDIAPILSEVENVPVITLEKPQYPLESAYNICDPSMTKVRQEADGGTVFNYDTLKRANSVTFILLAPLETATTMCFLSSWNTEVKK